MKLPTKITLASVLALCALNVHAALIGFTDRDEFETYVGSYDFDDLSTIEQGGLSGHQRVREGYEFDIVSYGCQSSGCGHQESQGMYYPGYLWTYRDGNFLFDDPIYAFGVDFGSYNSLEDFGGYENRNPLAAQVSLNGILSELTYYGGFLGIADTEGLGFQSVQYGKATPFGSLDNVTYSYDPVGMTPSPVPLPPSIFLFLSGLLGLGLMRRKTKT